MKLITVLEAQNVMDLVIPRTKLEDAGIACYLRNEISSQVLNYIPYVTVELQVSETDVEKAMEILEKIENA